MQEPLATTSGNDVPQFGTLVAVDADLAPSHRRRGEAAENQRDVAGTANHWVRSVGITLADAARMHMNIGDDCELAFLAQLPEASKVLSVEPDDSGIEASRVDVVVEYEVDDPSTTVVAVTEQERTALSTSTATSFAETF